eukprot:829589-Pelagomonas_calceolata.AAC.6
MALQYAEAAFCARQAGRKIQGPTSPIFTRYSACWQGTSCLLYESKLPVVQSPILNRGQMPQN